MPVYFVQAVDGGPVKIGHSVHVPARIKQLESHYGRRLAVLATMPGGRAEERKIHVRFSHLRFGRSEQFRPEPDLMAFIDRPLFVNASPVVAAMATGSKPICVTFSPPHYEQLEQFARRRGLSMTSCVRMIVIQAMKDAKAFGVES